jgi:hypothetical protein
MAKEAVARDRYIELMGALAALAFRGVPVAIRGHSEGEEQRSIGVVTRVGRSHGLAGSLFFVQLPEERGRQLTKMSKTLFSGPKIPRGQSFLNGLRVSNFVDEQREKKKRSTNKDTI